MRKINGTLYARMSGRQHKRKSQAMNFSHGIARQWRARRLLSIAMIISLGVALPSTHVAAIQKYRSTSMSCSSIHALILNQNAVILGWTSPRTGNPLYDRYVRNEHYCLVNQTTRPTYIPASDTKNCRVFYCVNRERNCRWGLGNCW